MLPSGTLLGTWERSSNRARLRLVVLGVAGLIFLFLHFVAGTSLLVSAVLGIFFILDLPRAFLRPEKTFSLYTDGFVVRGTEGNDLYVYGWRDIFDARWPTAPTGLFRSEGETDLTAALLGCLVGMVVSCVMT